MRRQSLALMRRAAGLAGTAVAVGAGVLLLGQGRGGEVFPGGVEHPGAILFAHGGQVLGRDGVGIFADAAIPAFTPVLHEVEANFAGILSEDADATVFSGVAHSQKTPDGSGAVVRTFYRRTRVAQGRNQAARRGLEEIGDFATIRRIQWPDGRCVVRSLAVANGTSAGVTPTSSKRPSEPRICNKCGMDLTGKVRYRDEQGYWCSPCSKADKAARRENSLPCDDCGQQFPKTELRPFGEDMKLCSVCHQKADVARLRREMEQREAAERQARVEAIRRKRDRLILVGSMVAIVGSVALIVRGCMRGEQEATTQPTTAPASGVR